MSYSVDTSALMDAWFRYYPPDVFGSLWERLDELVNEGRLLAIDEVRRELSKKADDLLEWATQRARMFVPLDRAIQDTAKLIIAGFPSLTNTKSAMRGMADPFVIALGSVWK